jgi:hypothetical protein
MTQSGNFWIHPRIALALDMSGQFHAPGALSPGKAYPVPIGREEGWALELITYTTKTADPVGNWISVVQKVTILTELSGSSRNPLL